MDRITQGIRNFQNGFFRQHQDLYERLEKGQNPDTFFITCGDSRIDPFRLTDSLPGDLFIIRNAGNMVLPFREDDSCPTAAALEFAVEVVGIARIVICGHTDCGAMRAALYPETIDHLPALKQWLAHAADVRRKVLEGPPGDDRSMLIRMVKENVVTQISNLKTHPTVANAVDSGRLRLQGLFYSIGTGQIETVSENPDGPAVWSLI